MLRDNMTDARADVPYGVLDLFVLKTLDAMGPLHGFGIARRIEQTSGQQLQINQGSIYPALLRLQQNGWIQGEWGASEKNRRAKYYSLTEVGRRHLAGQVKDWEQTAALVARFLESAS
jgi:transcriptional regulator|tara:strand:+ start:187 stop:540 length:354 start_codon:yes stop_codon:yes gene_type:complete